MINFFIENNILMIVLLSLFIIIELVIFKATEDNVASQRKTQRISATIVTVMIFYAMYIIPTALVEKHIEHLNVDDTIVQNYTMAKNINDGLVKEQVITFTKRDDAWYDKNEFVSFVQPLKDQVKFIVVANNDTVVQLQHTDGDVVKVTKEKYPKLWKFVKSYLKNNITN